MAYVQQREHGADVGVKEAFGVLHQGLSCLAGRITATDSHSAHIAAQLTSNWEQLARRMGEMRVDFDESHRTLDARPAAADYGSRALDHALDKIAAFARQHAVDEVPDFEDIFAQPEPVNFLARARMMARTTSDAPRPRIFLAASVSLIALLTLATGFVLHRRAEQTVIVRPALPDRIYSLSGPGSQNAVFLRPAQKSNVQAALSVDRVRQLADQGNPLALTILGLRTVDGANGAAANLPDAVGYLTRAAEMGQAVAQFRLGTLYERGQGVAVDLAKASHWYELSAAQGNRKAMHNLAVFYAYRKDMGQAARWFAKAAALGLSDSEFNLAVLYERGDGVPQSLVNAFKWYSIAAAAGDAESKAHADLLATQLDDADKAMAAKAVQAFRPLPFDPGANMPPQADQLPSS